MDLKELEKLILENDSEKLDRAFKKQGIIFRSIESSLSHNYIKYGEIYSFQFKRKDKTRLFILKDADDKYSIENINFVGELFYQEQISIIKDKFNKNPIFKKLLIRYIDAQETEPNFNSNVDIANLIAIRYLEDKKVYANSIDLLSFDLEKSGEWERLFDKMQLALSQHKSRHYIESFLSNKYNFLITSETYEYGDILRESSLSKEDIRKGFFAKIQKYKTKEDFNCALKEYAERCNKWNKVNIKEAIKKENIKIMMENDDEMIVEISSFEEMKKIGSQSWCITTMKGYFDDYMSGLNRQFIIFDFNREYKDPEFIIGVTTDAKLIYQVAHDNHDNLISAEKEDDIKKTIRNSISKQSKSEVEDRLEKYIKDGVDNKIIVDLIIYYNLIEFGMKWANKKNVNLGESAFRFSIFIVSIDYKLYIKNIKNFGVSGEHHLSRIFTELDEQVEIKKDVAIKIVSELPESNNAKETIIQNIKDSDQHEYFNIIENIKNNCFYNF